MTLAKAGLSILTPDQMARVHQSALGILEKAGIQVENQAAARVFTKAGCPGGDKGRVFLPGEMVSQALQTVPHCLDIYQRNGKKAFSLDAHGPNFTIFGIGVTNLYYQEPLTDEVVPFTRAHMAKAARLGHVLEEFNVISTPGVIRDMPEHQAEIAGFLEMAANTFKPIVLLVSEPKAFKTCLDIMEGVIGLEKEKPWVVPYLNPITPLVFNAETTLKMDMAIERGLPVIFSNYGMAGATTPITPGGTWP